MERSVRRFRSEVRQLALGKSPQAVRYPVAFRETAVALARPRLGQGQSLIRIARALGVSPPTLAGWLRPRGASVLRPVAVAPDPEAPVGLVLITAHGVRVEGLDCDAWVQASR
jgi:transposase-like protein